MIATIIPNASLNGTILIDSLDLFGNVKGTLNTWRYCRKFLFLSLELFQPDDMFNCTLNNIVCTFAYTASAIFPLFPQGSVVSSLVLSLRNHVLVLLFLSVR